MDLPDLERLVKTHKHLGRDLTQPLTTGGFYGGKVASDASSNTLPSGWTASVNGSHLYTITHNLGNASYAVVAGTNSYSLNACVQSHGANTFTIDFENSSGTAFATDFDFVLIPI